MELPGFPEDAAATIAASTIAEFATSTATGVPLDTPLLSWVSDDGTTVDVTTGLSYPAKAERARKRPDVGLCLVGDGSGPVVAIAAQASVRDADVQANAERYASLTGPMVAYLSGGRPWEELRGAVWYWARIWITCTPLRVWWWPDGTGKPAQVWDAPAGTRAPASDPAPAGKPTRAPGWAVPDWRANAKKAAAELPLPYLTAYDSSGFPIPFPVSGVSADEGGLRLEVPAGAPWELAGPASACFNGQATFVGSLDGPYLRVERQLPDLPLVADNAQIFDPQPATREALAGRLQAELDRRGQPAPTMGPTPPPGFAS